MKTDEKTDKPQTHRHDRQQSGNCRGLFRSFFKIGLFTFGGGYAMIPLIEREIIVERNWIEAGDFLKLLTLAQSAPGPIALNTAVFVGYKVKGYRGAVSAILGAVLPSFMIILIIAHFFKEIKDVPVVVAAFKGMRPAVVGLVVAPMISLAKGMNWKKIALAIVAALSVWYFGISPVYCILVGAIAGFSYTAWKNRKNLER